MNYFVQLYTCESGAIGKIIIPEDATEDDLLAFKDFLDIVVRERLKRLEKPQESDHKCHTCKHYTSGEHDGSCGSYICKEYSNWESEGKE